MKNPLIRERQHICLRSCISKPLLYAPKRVGSWFADCWDCSQCRSWKQRLQDHNILVVSPYTIAETFTNVLTLTSSLNAVPKFWVSTVSVNYHKVPWWDVNYVHCIPLLHGLLPLFWMTSNKLQTWGRVYCPLMSAISTIISIEIVWGGFRVFKLYLMKYIAMTCVHIFH